MGVLTCYDLTSVLNMKGNIVKTNRTQYQYDIEKIERDPKGKVISREYEAKNIY